MRILVLALFALSFLAVQGQRFLFENISVTEGLPSSKVYCMVQDHAGVIWVGTDAGLVRYDGKCKTYAERDGMAPNGVKALHIDESGAIWAGHLGGGLSKLVNRRGIRVDLTEAISVDITGIVSAPDGGIWVGTEGEGVWHISDVNAEGTVGLQKKLPLRVDKVFSIDVLDEGVAFIAGNNEIWIAQKDGSFKERSFPEIPQTFPIVKLFQASNGSIWIGTVNGGAYELPQGQEAVHFNSSKGLPGSIVMCFAESKDKEIWIGTWDGGLARVQENGVRSYSTSNGLHGNTVRSLLADREGIILVGTNENGLDIYKGERFLHFGQDDDLIDPHVWAGMEDDRGNLWFGTNGGITMLSKSGRPISFSAEKNGLSSDKVRSIVQTKDRRIWIGTENGGLLEFDRNSFEFDTDVPFQTQLASASVTALIEGAANELWVGTYEGLIRFEIETGFFEFFNVADGLSGNTIKCLYKDNDGSLWIGIRGGGINRYDNGVFRQLDLRQSFTPTSFVRDKEGKLWVGTEGNGMLVLDNEEKILGYTQEDGLMSNTIRSLALDTDGNVWVGTNKGANEWRAEEGRFIKYTGQSGFVGVEAKQGAVWSSKDGSLWFGTSDGAIKVGKEQANEAAGKPLVVIHALDVDEQRIDLGTIDLRFRHDARNFRFRYGAVSLSDPGAVRYQIRLKGLSEKWALVTEATSVEYTALPAGDYVFQAKAMDRAGIWSDPVSLSFTVSPPWWQTWWFYGLSALGLFLGINLYTRWRGKQLKLRNLVLEKRVDERTAEVVEQGKEIEHQKNRVEELLLNILPKNISEELSEKGWAKARAHPAVTVMFTDMKGFTQVAAQMSATELVQELHDHFGKFDDVTDSLGMEKIKTIGDSYMAACGIPESDEHHAIKSVLAGLQIRELMRNWQQQREAAGELSWSLRIGIHSGSVVAGVVGKRKFAYDIWGDTVNTASRMESSGEPDKLNVSQATWDLVKQYVEGEHRGKVKAKNMGEVDMYFINRLKPEYSLEKDGLIANDKLRTELGLVKAHTADLA